MRESQYQLELIRRIRDLLPGCVILRNDPKYVQGVPDILILYRHHWAMLEVKLTPTSDHRPNQEYYVGLLNDMSFSAFIYPENEEEVLHDLQLSFGIDWEARIP